MMQEYTNIRIVLRNRLKEVYPVDKILDAQTEFLNCRNRVIFQLMLETGITPLEIANLTWDDLIVGTLRNDQIIRSSEKSKGVVIDNSNVRRKKKMRVNLIAKIDSSPMIGKSKGAGTRQLMQRKVKLSESLVLLLEKLLIHSSKKNRTNGPKLTRQLPVICAARLTSIQQVAMTKDAISNLVSEHARTHKLRCNRTSLTPSICRKIALITKAERLARNNDIDRSKLLKFSGLRTWRSISDLVVNPIHTSTSASDTISLF